ncbi:MAG TPA: PepSY domain-containing protein [Bacillota bacterium]|nr:PepSY domain-containing protein [Bacillota bacterium]
MYYGYHQPNHFRPCHYNPFPPQHSPYYAEHNLYRQISIEEAMRIALERVPGEVVKIELDTEQGVIVYEVDIVTNQGIEYEVVVDRNTGRIIEIKPD